MHGKHFQEHLLVYVKVVVVPTVTGYDPLYRLFRVFISLAVATSLSADTCVFTSGISALYTKSRL